ncbi:MAG: PIG-L deacetylase family protein [Acidimicrobiia bacterium]
MEPFPEDWSRALCVVAHPDDLEYGMAGAIAKWTAAGKEVSYLLVTRGEHGIDGMAPADCSRVREDEERAGARVVGVDTVEFLEGHTDGLIEYGTPLRRDLALAIRRHRPEVLLSINFRESWGGRSFNMADHRNVGWALLDAARDSANRWLFSEPGTEPWNGVRLVGFSSAPVSTHYVDIGDFVDTGVASLREHTAYIAGLGDPDFDPDAFLRGSARAAGAQVGCDHAVPFEVFEL